MINTIKEIPLTLEGKMLVTAIGLLMATEFKNKTPEEVYKIIYDLVKKADGE